jgi:hypothetical protein
LQWLLEDDSRADINALANLVGANGRAIFNATSLRQLTEVGQLNLQQGIL